MALTLTLSKSSFNNSVQFYINNGSDALQTQLISYPI